MATLFKQPGGGVLVRVRIKGYPRVSRQFHNKSEAREWASVVEGAMRSGAWRDPSSARDTLLSALIKDFISEVIPTRKSEHCINDETLRLQRIADMLGDFSLATLSQQAVAAYRDQRLKVVKPATVNRELSILTAVLNWARREKEIPLNQNVASGTLVRRPKTNNGRNRRLSAPEEEKLLVELAKCQNPLVLPGVKLLLATGLRCGEMLSLDWQCIDYENHAIFLPDTKNGHARTAPLTFRAEQILLSLKREEDQSRVFDGLTYEGLKQAFERARKRAKLADLRLHDLRHEAASRAAESGMLSINELQAFTGHRDIRMVTRYAHILPGSVAKKLRQAGL